METLSTVSKDTKMLWIIIYLSVGCLERKQITLSPHLAYELLPISVNHK
jgi:hypothetical protein